MCFCRFLSYKKLLKKLSTFGIFSLNNPVNRTHDSSSKSSSSTLHLNLVVRLGSIIVLLLSLFPGGGDSGGKIIVKLDDDDGDERENRLRFRFFQQWVRFNTSGGPKKAKKSWIFHEIYLKLNLTQCLIFSVIYKQVLLSCFGVIQNFFLIFFFCPLMIYGIIYYKADFFNFLTNRSEVTSLIFWIYSWKNCFSWTRKSRKYQRKLYDFSIFVYLPVHCYIHFFRI